AHRGIAGSAACEPRRIAGSRGGRPRPPGPPSGLAKRSRWWPCHVPCDAITIWLTWTPRLRGRVGPAVSQHRSSLGLRPRLGDGLARFLAVVARPFSSPLRRLESVTDWHCQTNRRRPRSCSGRGSPARQKAWGDLAALLEARPLGRRGENRAALSRSSPERPANERGTAQQAEGER